MPWTEADREEVLNAMRQIRDGKRIVTVTTADRSETRQMLSVDDGQKILAMIDGSITGASARPRIIRTRYDKAL